jgi:hypothetical protein
MSRVTADVIGSDIVSDDRDGRSDLDLEFSQLTDPPSQLDPDPGPSRAAVTPSVTLPVWWRRRREARQERKSERRAAREARGRGRHRITPAGRRELPKIIAVPVFLAQMLMASCITLATVASIVVSWRDLYEWGLNHRWGGYAVAVPLMVDTFIVIGEMALFILISLGFTWHGHMKIYLGAAFSFLFGLALSVYGNVGHLIHADVSTRGGFALPPVGAALGLAIGLGVLKLIAAAYDSGPGGHDDAPDGPEAPASITGHGASILVPVTVHKDKVAHPVAHAGASGTDGPKMVRPAVNGASRSARVRSNPAMEHAAREYLARLRREGQPLPKDRALAKSHFNPGGQGNGNRRAARRILVEFTEAP